MPRLTVRAMAEMLKLPAYEQIRILHEQKYPKQQPQTFRTPFYLPAISAIREFYRSNRNAAALAQARQDCSHLGLQARRDHNLRVLTQFESGFQYNRRLVPELNSRIRLTIGQVELRLSADLRAAEGRHLKVIFYNCRAAPVDAEIARKTLEIGLWVLDNNGIILAPLALEFVDLHVNRVHRVARRNPQTIRLLKRNIQIIETLWPTI